MNIQTVLNNEANIVFHYIHHQHPMINDRFSLYELFENAINNPFFRVETDEEMFTKRCNYINDIQNNIKMIPSSGNKHELRESEYEQQILLGCCFFQMFKSEKGAFFTGLIILEVSVNDSSEDYLKSLLKIIPEVVMFFSSSKGRLKVIVSTDLHGKLSKKFHVNGDEIKNYDLRLYRYCRQSAVNHFRDNYGIEIKYDESPNFNVLSAYGYDKESYFNKHYINHECFMESVSKINEDELIFGNETYNVPTDDTLDDCLRGIKYYNQSCISTALGGGLGKWLCHLSC